MRAAEWRMVWIDQVPLRNDLVTDCNAAMAELDQVRRKWHHFERKDKPAFVRWRAREFGALLSRAREIEDKIQEARQVIHEVEQELRRFFQTPQSAYARVMFRRENPGLAEPDVEMGGGTTRALTEYEQEVLFRDWVQKYLGTNPDKMDDDAYSTSFEVFKAHMFTRSSQPSPDTGRERPNRPPSFAKEAAEEEDDAAVDERVKRLYRRLARQLHPDARGDGTVEASMLWHDVQEAYAASDVARMELLLALSQLQSDALEAETSLGELILVQGNLRRSLRALTKSVREAEKEDAWDFARIGPTPQIAADVERRLKFDLGHRTRFLEQLQGALAEWQR